MKRVRPFFFWTHLVAGVAASLLIGVMSVTGAGLAFEAQWIAASDPPGASPTTPIETWSAGASSITLFKQPTRRAVVMKGRDQRFVVGDSGEWIAATSVSGFMHTLEQWHRWLGLEGAGRDVGKALMDAANLLFVLLALTGLVIWWPKKLDWQHVKPVLLFRVGLKGKQRDFNWHHVVGLWLWPALLAISVSGVVMSYRWAQGLIGGGGRPGGAAATLLDDGETLPLAQLFSNATSVVPDWDSVSLQVEQRGEPPPAGKRKALQFSVMEAGRSLPAARHTVTIDPVTGAVLAHEDFDSAPAGRKTRMILRFLHTGQLFGVVGQFLALVASLGAVLLMWTGLALSWRRFFRLGPRKEQSTASLHR